MGVAIPQVVAEDRASGAQVIDGSLDFNGESTNAYLSKTFASAGTEETWTVSLWFKLDNPSNQNMLFCSGPDGPNRAQVTVESDGTLNCEFRSGGSVQAHKITSRLFRDPGAWYHLVIAVNTNDGTAGDRIKIYINGERETAFSTSNDFGSGDVTQWMKAIQHFIGKRSYSTDYFDGRMSQFYCVDGSQLEPTEFGFTDPLTNTWRPKKVNTRNLDVAQGQYAIKSSEQSSDGQNAVNAFNGNINNEFAARWRNNGSEDGNLVGNTFLGQDFGVGNEKEITKFRILQGRSSGTGEMVSGVKMQWSDNNSDWTDAGTFTLDTSTFAYQEFAVNPVGKHRSWRLLCNASSNSAWLITELEMLSSNAFDKDVFGQNGFYLPFDGNSLIGEDKSGNGNDWTPIGFGGSNYIDKATGAKPILRTVNGGNVASGGARSLHKTYAVTVQNDGGNKYFFDGVNNTGTTIPLYRGGVYTFDQSDSSNSGHPLRFATAADAAGSTEYSDGVTQSGTPGSANAFTRIVVPHNAPDTLYYYCTNHNGMGGATANTTDDNVADPYAWKCVLALPLVNNANDVSNHINPSSTEKSITTTGAAPTSSESNFYGGSYTFDGSDDRLSHNATDNGPLFLQSDFTVEGWANLAAGQTDDRYMFALNQNVSTTSETCWHLRINNSKWQGIIVNGGTQFSTTAANNYTPNKWQHIAWVREGDQERLYIDGTLSDLSADTERPNLNNGSDLFIGALRGTNNNVDGEFQDLRIYSGVAKYTEDFIPASTNPDITLDTPSGVVYPSITDKPNVGSVSFDGSSDYLSLASSVDFALGTNDWTIEYFAYPTSTAQYQRHFYLIGSNATQIEGIFADGNGISFGKTGVWAPTAVSHPLNQWNHYVLVHDSTNMRLYINGTQVLTSTDNFADENKSLHIGYSNSNFGGYFTGFISNFRVLKGTALYTSNFTPPRDALTNITNTSLICCQTIDDPLSAEVTPASLTANGSPTASRFNPIDNNIETVLGEPDGYCTLNPLFNSYAGDTTLTDGNLHYNGRFSSSYALAQGTIGISTGKWYWELTMGATGPNIGMGVMRVGISTSAWPGLTNETAFISGVDGGIGLYMPGDANNIYYWNGSTQASVAYSFPAPTVAGDTVSIALDLDTPNNGKIYFAKNGMWGDSGNPEAGTNPVGLALTGTYVPACSLGASGISSATFNFGQRPFRFPPPKGFKTISKSNVRVGNPAALEPDKYFNTVLYTGNGSSQSITGFGFQPDFVWVKNRDNAYYHRLWDSVRGVGRKGLYSNTTEVEGTWEQSGVSGNDQDQVTSFDDDGFSVLKGPDGDGLNSNTVRFVAWCWKAGDVPNKTYTVKVVSDSGNKYRFNDYGTSAFTIELQEGGTFTFDQSDSSNSGHPLRFSTTSDGTHGAGTEYTTGVVTNGTPGSAGAYTRITVPLGAPTLYYYCSVHSGMGGQANTPERGYTDFGGTIPAKISTNVDAGFSIVTYTGNGLDDQTVGHGLNSAPELILQKDRTEGTYAWNSWHMGLNSDSYIQLNSSGGQDNSVDIWRSDRILATTFGLGNWSNHANNRSGEQHICYCWHSVEGFSKFGVYQGNGNSQGVFIHCGFKPALIMIKAISRSGSWFIMDSTRDVDNPVGNYIYANSADQEDASTSYIDILSNGFKQRNTGNSLNANTESYIFAAWAEAPSMNLYGAQPNPR